MAKSSYKIPTSLDRSLLDHELAPLPGAGPRIAMKVLLFWAASLLVLMFVVLQTWVASSGFILITLTIIAWLAATAYFGKYTKTREMRISTVPAAMSYLPIASRRVRTRMTSNPSAFSQIVGIKNVDDKTGLITFNDGNVGQAYIVVGSASRLLFTEDRKAMLDRVDGFWRQIDERSEWITVTTKEPQRVLRQLAHLEDLNQALEPRDPELYELLDEKFRALMDHVGGRFASIHQYMIIRSSGLESLRNAHATLAAEAKSSSMMIKEAIPLDGEGALDMLRTLYTFTPDLKTSRR